MGFQGMQVFFTFCLKKLSFFSGRGVDPHPWLGKCLLKRRFFVRPPLDMPFYNFLPNICDNSNILGSIENLIKGGIVEFPIRTFVIDVTPSTIVYFKHLFLAQNRLTFIVLQKIYWERNIIRTYNLWKNLFFLIHFWDEHVVDQKLWTFLNEQLTVCMDTRIIFLMWSLKKNCIGRGSN